MWTTIITHALALLAGGALGWWVKSVGVKQAEADVVAGVKKL